jgi:hypothetical protein
MHPGLSRLRRSVNRRLDATALVGRFTHKDRALTAFEHAQVRKPAERGVVRARYIGLLQFGHSGRTMAYSPLSRGNSVASIIAQLRLVTDFIKRLVEIQTHV